ncbi:piggyBac transposable element-derived protein 4-like [Xyrichtys novacula]|uniref:PiggyBac transposable element-derived protein 4-like n=1 Tax=Xyrichtys novacula TaxID=13765 RepID=A0AAV1G9P3_XYRNO|nr:piggyBac transposable element-derived protein 4-like [Xyrichtys novacula]
MSREFTALQVMQQMLSNAFSDDANPDEEAEGVSEEEDYEASNQPNREQEGKEEEMIISEDREEQMEREVEEDGEHKEEEEEGEEEDEEEEEGEEWVTEDREETRQTRGRQTGGRKRGLGRVYIPSKPAKYGIKTWVACDSKSSYAWKMQVNTGKATATDAAAGGGGGGGGGGEAVYHCQNQNFINNQFMPTQ